MYLVDILYMEEKVQRHCCTAIGWHCIAHVRCGVIPTTVLFIGRRWRETQGSRVPQDLTNWGEIPKPPPLLFIESQDFYFFDFEKHTDIGGCNSRQVSMTSSRGQNAPSFSKLGQIIYQFKGGPPAVIYVDHCHNTSRHQVLQGVVAGTSRRRHQRYPVRCLEVLGLFSSQKYVVWWMIPSREEKEVVD